MFSEESCNPARKVGKSSFPIDRENDGIAPGRGYDVYKMHNYLLLPRPYETIRFWRGKVKEDKKFYQCSLWIRSGLNRCGGSFCSFDLPNTTNETG
jgi:hypothetical protein